MTSENKDDLSNTPFRVSIKAQSVSLEFASYPEIAAWADKEQRLWEEALSSYARGDGYSGTVKTRQCIFDHLRKHAQGSDKGSESARVQVRKWFERDLERGFPIISESPIGEQILKLAKENNLACLAEIWRRDPERTVHYRFEENHSIAIFVASVDDSISNNISNYIDDSMDEKLLYKMREFMGEANYLKNKLHNDTEKFEKYIVRAEERKRSFEKAGLSLGRRWKDEVDALRSAYEDKLKIGTPVSYWERRAESMDKLFRRSIALFFAISSVALVALFVRSESISNFLDGETYFSAKFLAAILLPALGVAWILRVILKVAYNSMENANDARLRSTMALTYLALIKDPKSRVSDEDRILALTALFRPADAKGDNETVPPSVLDLLSSKKSTKD